MSDIMTFEELKGTIKGKKVVWFGPANNVFNSYVHASKKFDFNKKICNVYFVQTKDRKWRKKLKVT